VYSCNLNGNGTYNESDDGQHIACNYLSWDDLVAYLDWAALRPMTELEYEKSCRGGNQNPTANEFAWGNTSATALSGLSNASNMSETASSSSSNIAYNNSFTTGPVRTGIFATGSTSRATSGSGYYGNMELSGNLWERVVTVGNAAGRTFSGVHGNGTLTAGGAADVSGWPAAAGTGWKGGSWLNTTTNSATTSDRAQAANADNTRSADAGGRGVRTISSGIVTNGLVLWLDAGIAPSYAGSGTTWTDISGNRNNGTLTNGPTYNSSNGGSIVFDGVNDYVTLNSPQIAPGTGAFTWNFWVKINNLSNFSILFSGTGSNTGYGAIALNPVSTGLVYYANGIAIIDNNTSFGNNWWFISFVGNGGPSGSRTLKLFRNSSQAGSTYTADYNFTSNTPNIGANHSWYAELMRGFISNVTYYNRALSSAEILQNFNAQKALFGL
jgi:hypothetical protein